MAENEVRMDALMPTEMADKAEIVGIKKADLDFSTTFILSVLAGAFIAVGAVFATTVTAGSSALPFGVAKLLGGLVFCLGLILVVIAGAELFTGNNLIVMAWAAKRVSTIKLLRNWLIVYLGNFVGSIATALLMLATKQYTFGAGIIGLQAMNTASGKMSYDFLQALALGIMCNALVCLAVWLTFSARTVADKIIAIIFPITAFVAAGFEHSVANMYFVPMGLFIKATAPASFWEAASKLAGKAVTADSYASLTWGHFLVGNLLPVTIGNIIGGALMVGGVYWFAYRRSVKLPSLTPPTEPGGRLAANRK